MEIKATHLLTLLFVWAKITGEIDWSWWLVFLPSILSAVVFLIGTGMIAAKNTQEKLRKKR